MSRREGLPPQPRIRESTPASVIMNVVIVEVPVRTKRAVDCEVPPAEYFVELLKDTIRRRPKASEHVLVRSSPDSREELRRLSF